MQHLAYFFSPNSHFSSVLNKRHSLSAYCNSWVDWVQLLQGCNLFLEYDDDDDDDVSPLNDLTSFWMGVNDGRSSCPMK